MLTPSIGEVVCTICGKDDARLAIYVDAFYPAYRISFTSSAPVQANLRLINYRDAEMAVDTSDNSNYLMLKTSERCTESADINFIGKAHAVGQYHENRHSFYTYSLKNQNLQDFPGQADSLLGRAFGFWFTCDKMNAVCNTALNCNQPETQLNISVYSLTRQCIDVQEWKTAIWILAEADPRPALVQHRAAWRKKWEQQYVIVTGGEKAELLTRAYCFQRYMNLIAGTGNCPIKFNGSIFTMESIEKNGHQNYDYRRWGSPYWLQNTRLIYWNMLYSGDFGQMLPFLRCIFPCCPLPNTVLEYISATRVPVFPKP